MLPLIRNETKISLKDNICVKSLSQEPYPKENKPETSPILRFPKVLDVAPQGENHHLRNDAKDKLARP